MRQLVHTRFVLDAYMPDLTFQSAREYFVAQHPIQGPNGEERPKQDEWRNPVQLVMVLDGFRWFLL